MYCFTSRKTRLSGLETSRSWGASRSTESGRSFPHASRSHPNTGTSVWGVSILFVEIRDIVIPKDLQRAMSAEARADREKDARIVLAEVERDIAAMLHDASDIYRDDDIALKLRQMHLVNESLKDSKGSIVVPSSYADGFVEGGADKDGR